MHHLKHIPRSLALACTLTGALALAGSPAVALEIDPHVTPQIDIGGRALVTVKAFDKRDAGGALHSDSELEFADSSLLFGFSKYLFDSEHYAFAVIGLKALEDEPDADIRDDIYLHQMHVGLGGERFEIKLGRSNLPNTLLGFPTLRHDDLMDFTHIGNAFSHAPDEVYQLYGGMLAGSVFWPRQRLAASAAFTARTTTDSGGQRSGSADFNGKNLRLAYELPEAIKFERGLRYAALAWDRQDLDGPGETGIDALQAAAAINLNSDPQATWNLDLQATWVDGMTVADLAASLNRTRASSRSLVAALRYGHRPWLQTRWQAAVSAGWKDYDDFSDATAWTLAPSFSYRLGSGVTALAQYQYRSHASGLAAATDLDREQRLYIGLAFDFDYTLNKHVGSRDSIMFLEHNMLDIGPARGGH